LLLAVPVLFLALGANSIWDANEAFYVETPRQMVESGDYVNPSFNGLPRFNKPVLSYWIVAGFYQVFGVSVAIERLTIALGMAGILLGAWLIGRTLRSPATGALAALLLVTAPRLVFFSRRIAIDIFMTLFMTLALACFVLAERHPQYRRRYLLLMYAALGLGVLTKGPVAIAIPALVCGVWLLTERRVVDIRRLMLPIGTVIVLAIVLPWYAALHAQHGWEPIRFFFFDENLGRYANPLTAERGPAFFLFALFGDVLLPWAPLIAMPIVSAWRRTGSPDPGGAIRRLLWWWVVTIVIVFSLSASKEDLYILPAIPAAAVLVADALIATGFGATHRGIRGVLIGIALLCVALAVLVAMYFTSGHYTIASAPALSAVLAVTGAAAFALLWRGRHGAAVMTLAAGFALFNYIFVLWALPDVERLKPVPPLARVINERASPAAAIGSLNVEVPSLVYYARRPVVRLANLDEAAAYFAGRPEVWMLAGERDWSNLHTRVPSTCVAARHPLFLAKGSDIIRGQPPPDVLLITTRCQ
jgi:4-amino-4-deoxy-L-arabinose transferase-like glycosyltransferase